ncbi:unnamed protein product [Dimorphilus gyrociliatus]|uniref:Mab-21-like HhH/H2TH-like domain-containing protein n=1 Tax=Dimorphilus gyrociliatus TaxID=2664684 RepID=A0A7I8VPY8_9ANNE|nr:unnamed protein product [Dimorphilus gyrociliatus]
MATVPPTGGILEAVFEEYYTKIARPSTEKICELTNEVYALLEKLIPKLKVLLAKVGAKFLKVEYCGSVFNGTCTSDCPIADVLIVLDKKETKIKSKEPGFKWLLAERFKTDGPKKDGYRWARCSDGIHLSSQMLLDNLYRCTKTSLMTSPDITVSKNTNENVVEVRKDKKIIYFTPALNLDGNSFAVSRFYANDSYQTNELYWRLHHDKKTTSLLSICDKADEGVRRKSLIILKSFFRREPSLSYLKNHHILHATLHSLDLEVDHIQRWQKWRLDGTVLRILEEIKLNLKNNFMADFFIPGRNLFYGIEKSCIANMLSRLTFILDHHCYFARLLHKQWRDIAFEEDTG